MSSATFVVGRVRIHKSWEQLFDGEIGLSIGDGKKIMAALQSAVAMRQKPIPSFAGLPGLSQVPGGQGLHGAPDPNRFLHR